MKIRFNNPTETLPFFHNVSVQTKDGWKKVLEISERGTVSALFPNKEEMIRRVKGVRN